MSAPSPSASFRGLVRRALGFAGLGLVLYALLFAAAEQLVLATGHANPMFKIATLQSRTVDWVVLGTSHAMPLDFGDTPQQLQRSTGLQFVNLAATGAGPLYNRFVLEQFLREHRARNVLVVVDSFAFASRTWNEERFEDAKLLARTPFDRGTAQDLWHYVRAENVPVRAWLDYATGFSKINNRDRFQPDRWDGERQFEQVWRPSASAVKKRMQYLYPDPGAPAALERYAGELARLVAVAQGSGARVLVIKMPTPAQYRAQLPAEPPFDAALARVLASAGVPYRDFSPALPQPQFYFDSDHLNRAGVNEFLASHLAPLLAGDTNGGARF
jgi:hypothetical protein